jgi:hypothetical protein
MKPLFPKLKRPYYIVAPHFTQASAGIRVLYMLCHHLNLKGEKAYILFNTYHKNSDEYYNYLAPHLNSDIHGFYKKSNLEPIYIYPETIKGNPYKALHIVRYVLNYPGLLGGGTRYDNNELVYTYSEALRASLNHHDGGVLYIPACDDAIFYPPTNKEHVRYRKCFYAAKYQDIHQGKLFDLTNDCFEITRGRLDSPTQREMADILRESEILYVYENTSVATEAVMCGCPVVFIPNDFLTEPPLALKETGDDGIAWGTEEKDILKAKETVHSAYQKYLDSCEKFYKDLDKFIKTTQEMFAADNVSGIESTALSPGSFSKPAFINVSSSCSICKTRTFVLKLCRYLLKTPFKKIYRRMLKEIALEKK